MPAVSITRLRLRGFWDMLSFVWHTIPSSRQVQRATGYLGGATARESGGLIFWTVTVWTDLAAMKNFRNTGAHLAAMRRLIDICNEASYAHWQQDGSDLPSPEEAHRRMIAEGKLSKVRRPSPLHASGAAATDRAPTTLRVIPRR